MLKSFIPFSLRNWRFIPIFLLLVGLLFPVFSCAAHSDPGRTFTLIYANRINGQLDPCG